MKLLKLKQIRERQDLLQQHQQRSTNDANHSRSPFTPTSVHPSLSLSSTPFVSPTVTAPAEMPRSTSRISNASRSLPASRRNSSDTDDWIDATGLSSNPRTERAERAKESE